MQCTSSPSRIRVARHQPAKPDPAPRADGKCAQRGCTKSIPEIGRAEGDPFHATRCCRNYHGVVFMCDAAGDRYAAGRKA